MSNDKSQVTRILDAACAGDGAAAEELWQVVYQDLRTLAGSRLRSLPPGQTLQPTALVNEAFLRLVDSDGKGQVEWESRQHFFGAAARAMRNILVDEFRRRSRRKRGGGRRPEHLVEFDVADSPRVGQLDMLELDEALRRLEALAPRAAEVVVLRFFGGLTLAEAAESLGVSSATVEREWTYARAWLFRELGGTPGGSA
jgi:RNA polymerase sigma factor (TIGR02999 family)